VSGTTEPHNSNQSGCTGDQQSLSTSNPIQAVEAQHMITSSSHASMTSTSFTCENQATDIELTVNLTEESNLTTTSAFDKETSSDVSSVSSPVTKKQRLNCKKELDKTAAVKYRSRKKQERLSLVERQARLKDENTKLHEQVKSAEEEIVILKSALREVFAPCNHHTHTAVQFNEAENVTQSSITSHSVVQSIGTNYESPAVCTSNSRIDTSVVHSSGSSKVIQCSETNTVQHCVPSNVTVTSTASQDINTVTDCLFSDDMLHNILNTNDIDNSFTVQWDQLFPLL